MTCPERKKTGDYAYSVPPPKKTNDKTGEVLAKDLLIVSIGGPFVVATLIVGYCWIMGAGAMSIIDGKAPSLMKEQSKPQTHHQRHTLFGPRNEMR